MFNCETDIAWSGWLAGRRLVIVRELQLSAGIHNEEVEQEGQSVKSVRDKLRAIIYIEQSRQ